MCTRFDDENLESRSTVLHSEIGRLEIVYRHNQRHIGVGAKLEKFGIFLQRHDFPLDQGAVILLTRTAVLGRIGLHRIARQTQLRVIENFRLQRQRLLRHLAGGFQHLRNHAAGQSNVAVKVTANLREEYRRRVSRQRIFAD